MSNIEPLNFDIARIKPAQYAAAGELVVQAYTSLAGMPSVAAQPEYYQRLRAVRERVEIPMITVYVATTANDEVIGTVDFIADSAQYGAACNVAALSNAAGIRLLAVAARHRGRGVGKALMCFCIAQARELGRTQLFLHTTEAMQVAWKMYVSLGFARLPEIDFRQGALAVYGFRLALEPDAPDESCVIGGTVRVERRASAGGEAL